MHFILKHIEKCLLAWKHGKNTLCKIYFHSSDILILWSSRKLEVIWNLRLPPPSPYLLINFRNFSRHQRQQRQQQSSARTTLLSEFSRTLWSMYSRMTRTMRTMAMIREPKASVPVWYLHKQTNWECWRARIMAGRQVMDKTTEGKTLRVTNFKRKNKEV